MADQHTTPDQLDQWFRHAKTEGQPQHEHGQRVNIGLIFSVLVVLSTSVLVVTFGVQVYAEGQITRIKGERDMNFAGSEASLAYRATALEGQTSAQWIDRATGTIQLPLSQAQQAVIEDYAR